MSKNSDQCRPAQRGFALLEAIVALAILAASGLALFAALTQAMQMVNRAEQARERATVKRNVLAFVDTLDPVAKSSGSTRMGQYDLVWRSRLVEPAEDAATGTLEPGLYEVGLYTVEFRVLMDGELFEEFSVRKAGWRQVRELQVLN